jgi:uncharacterized protein YigA (DUF484 family)
MTTDEAITQLTRLLPTHPELSSVITLLAEQASQLEEASYRLQVQAQRSFQYESTLKAVLGQLQAMRQEITWEINTNSTLYQFSQKSD